MTFFLSKIPSLSAMTESLAAWLPQNEHAKKADNLAEDIRSLEESLINKTGQVFQNKVSHTIVAIQEAKQKCIDDLLRMNGSYYQDPKSTLKTAWDKLVQAVHTAIGVNVERSDQLDTVSAELDVDPNEAKEIAKKKIDHFKTIEKKRDARQNQLNQILSTEKAALNPEENLRLKQDLLKQRYQELCGSYFGDPNGQLHQAWTKYQTALAHGSTGENSLDSYQKLDAYRRQIESELYSIDQQLLIPASTARTYEVLTTEQMTQEVEALKKIQKTESDLSGIDWSGVATSAAKAVLVGAGVYTFLA
jgi:hypothetical protein